MKIGFLTACLPRSGLADLVRWASAQGFTALELAAWPVVSDRDYQSRQLDAAKFTKDDAARISEILAEHNISISAMAYYDNNLDLDLKVRGTRHDHLKSVILAAEMLNVGLVGTFVGARPDATPSDAMKEIGQVFRSLVTYAEDHGVRLMIENCPMQHWQRFGLPGNLAYSPELWDALFNEVPSDSFGLNFDPSHLYWLGIDYIRAAREYAPRIFHVHAKDTEPVPEGAYRFGCFGRQIDPVQWNSGWWRYRIPGLGRIDWQSFISVLRDNRYDHVLSIEHEDPVWEGTDEKVKHGLTLGLKHLAGFYRGGDAGSSILSHGQQP